MTGPARAWDRDELAAWLRLACTPGVGRESARRLLAAFGAPEAVLRASSAARRDVVMAAGPAKALATAPEGFDALLERTWSWLHRQASRAIVALDDPAYPGALLQTADPPLLLHVAGRRELLSAPALAIVGSRNPTPHGRTQATAFGRALSEAGWCVVSGLALGIDGAAHAGALDGPGSTIAVVGTGLDSTYPRQHTELADRIAREGLIVSEYSLGMPPLAANFPARNRLIAGLSRGTLVVEAALQSGSLITARLAAEAGREVFAMPGSVNSPQVRGCHALIKQGAKLVETVQDIFDELSPGTSIAVAQSPAPTAATGRTDPLLEALGYDPVGLDELVNRTGRAPADLNARLLELELEGHIVRLPGQLFQRVGQA
ncbi:MAG: DNA-processing protein DprA [Piscinibacter sp.]|nr:DNA-processing protein DprA [Piscinibacter sp.]